MLKEEMDGGCLLMNSDNEMRNEYSRAMPYIATRDGLSSASSFLNVPEDKQLGRRIVRQCLRSLRTFSAVGNWITTSSHRPFSKISLSQASPRCHYDLISPGPPLT
jgi:hypothetical protein